MTLRAGLAGAGPRPQGLMLRGGEWEEWCLSPPAALWFLFILAPHMKGLWDRSWPNSNTGAASVKTIHWLWGGAERGMIAYSLMACSHTSLIFHKCTFFICFGAVTSNNHFWFLKEPHSVCFIKAAVFKPVHWDSQTVHVLLLKLWFSRLVLGTHRHTQF